MHYNLVESTLTFGFMAVYRPRRNINPISATSDMSVLKERGQVVDADDHATSPRYSSNTTYLPFSTNIPF
jgi:hypothetical protein